MHHELGYFGNIWVRQNTLEHAGMTGGGHHHHFDHVSLLAKGRVRVSMDGKEPKEFTAPTFIVIRAECSHEIVALEDDTVYYCVFALRDINGEVIEPIFGEQHDPNPLSAAATDQQFWDRRKLIENI
jgi:hypothetical protein